MTSTGVSQMTFRHNAKWAKATKINADWVVALGFRGEFKAFKVISAPRALAAAYVVGWLKNQ
jgi:hypothetical protein